MPQCISPITIRQNTVSCGQCMPCRINVKRKQAAKILLEAAGHQDSCFITWTYNDENLPTTANGVPTVRREHGRLLGKLLARGLGFTKRSSVRHYTVGEYGTETGRPHMHTMLFGTHWYEGWTMAEALWTNGNITCSPVNETRADYIAGYCTKKLTKHDDVRLDEYQEPEFKVQVHQPALGSTYIRSVVAWYHTESGAAALAEYGDICHTFRWKGKKYPLTDYQKRCIRRQVGIPTTVTELREHRPDAHPIQIPPTLEELEERKIRHRNKVKRQAMYAQKTQTI